MNNFQKAKAELERIGIRVELRGNRLIVYPENRRALQRLESYIRGR